MKWRVVFLFGSLTANVYLLDRLNQQQNESIEACRRAAYERKEEVLLWAGAGRCYDRFQVANEIVNMDDAARKKCAERLRLRDAVMCAELILQFGQRYPNGEDLMSAREDATTPGGNRFAGIVAFLRTQDAYDKCTTLATQLERLIPIAEPTAGASGIPAAQP